MSGFCVGDRVAGKDGSWAGKVRVMIPYTRDAMMMVDYTHGPYAGYTDIVFAANVEHID